DHSGSGFLFTQAEDVGPDLLSATRKGAGNAREQRSGSIVEAAVASAGSGSAERTRAADSAGETGSYQCGLGFARGGPGGSQRQQSQGQRQAPLHQCGDRQTAN